MTSTLTQRLDLIKPTPGTNHQVSIAELNANADAIDAWLIPAAKMRLNSANQTIVTGAASTKISFDTIVYDTWNGLPEGAMANATTDDMTIRIDGLYLCIASVVWAANATGARTLNLQLNGTAVKRDVEPGATGANNELQIAIPIPCVAGDIINMSAAQTSGANLDVLAPASTSEIDGCSLSVTFLGKKP